MYFFFNDTATTEIYTLSLHDALPISAVLSAIKRREYDGYHYEAADASLALLIGRTTGEARPLFELESFRIISEKRGDGETTVEATIKLFRKGRRVISTRSEERRVGEGCRSRW